MSTTCASAALTVDVPFAFAVVFGGGGAFFAGAAFFGGDFFGGDFFGGDFFAAFGAAFFSSSGCSHTAVGLVTRPLPLDRSDSAEGTTFTSFFFTIGDLIAFAFAGGAFLAGGAAFAGGAFLAGGAGFGGGAFLAGAAFAGAAFLAIVFFGGGAFGAGELRVPRTIVRG